MYQGFGAGIRSGRVDFMQNLQCMARRIPQLAQAYGRALFAFSGEIGREFGKLVRRKEILRLAITVQGIEKF